MNIESLIREIVVRRYDEGEDDIRYLEDSLCDWVGDMIHLICVEEGERRGLTWREE